MKVLVAGAHGNTGRRVVRVLRAEGYEVRAMIRNESQGKHLSDLGAELVIADLTADVSHTVNGCQAVVFAAGAGPGAEPEENEDVDHKGAEKLIEAAEAAGADRFIMLSAQGAEDPEHASPQLKAFLEAKSRSDNRLRGSNLAYTILQAGRLTDEIGHGVITAAEDIKEPGSISREDVARAVVYALPLQNLYRRTIDIQNRDLPIKAALEKIGPPAKSTLDAPSR